MSVSIPQDNVVFAPDMIDLLRQCLETAWSQLNLIGKTRSKAFLAHRILQARPRANATQHDCRHVRSSVSLGGWKYTNDS